MTHPSGLDELQKRCHAALIVIFLAVFWASAFFGKVTASTPFLKLWWGRLHILHRHFHDGFRHDTSSIGITPPQ
jgi:hypothetical protein